MKPINIVFHPIYSQLALPKNHRFPIEKYQALHDWAICNFPNVFEVNLVVNPITEVQLKTVHSTDYVEGFISGKISEKAMKRIGFPWTPQFVDRTRFAVAGTLLTAELALEHGIALNMTGGYHHAHPDFGSGFCVFNDLVIAARHVIDQQSASRVLIFDCDVHQGDGTAASAERFDDIFSLSIHCEKNFPSRKQQSDLDLGLDKHLTDEDYLQHVRESLEAAIYAFKPDFIIYDAGVDIHVDDDLGLLDISTEGILQRDTLVFNMAKQHNIPAMAVIGGGYQRDIAALTNIHAQLLIAANKVYSN